MQLFALDQGFPLPIVNALRDYQSDAELVRLGDIDSRLTSDTEDWEVLLALHHHRRSWDGLITTNDKILNQARELWVLEQTKLTLVAAMGMGHNPVKASGRPFAYLSRICELTRPDRGQIWQLKAGNIMPKLPLEALERVADHQNIAPERLIAESRLSDEDFARDPLAAPELE